MAGSINKVILVGHLGADPDIRRTQDGRPIAHLRIATSESWRDRNSGERREKTEWHRVVIFSEGLCKVAEQYLRKGSKVYLEGQLQTRKWQDGQGQDRYATEVVLQGYGANLTMLDGRSEGGGGVREQAPQMDHQKTDHQSGHQRRSGDERGSGYERDDPRTHGPDPNSADSKYDQAFASQEGRARASTKMEDEIPF